jgi:predicted kinase
MDAATFLLSACHDPSAEFNTTAAKLFPTASEKQAVVIRRKHRLAAIATGHHMIDRTPEIGIATALPCPLFASSSRRFNSVFPVRRLTTETELPRWAADFRSKLDFMRKIRHANRSWDLLFWEILNLKDQMEASDTTSPQAVIFMGIQATGKSTFYGATFSKTHVRINLDMLRTRNRERLIFEACLAAGQSLVIDNTNPTKLDRERYLPSAKTHGFHVIGYYFSSRIYDSIKRNALRSEGQRIPEIGIRGTHARLELPVYQEGFDELYYIEARKGAFTVLPWSHEI